MKILKYFFVNFLAFGLAVGGTIYNIGWAWNLTVFYSWVFFIIVVSSQVVYQSKDWVNLDKEYFDAAMETAKLKKYWWYTPFETIYDVGKVGLFAATGHWVIASITLVYLSLAKYSANKLIEIYEAKENDTI